MGDGWVGNEARGALHQPVLPASRNQGGLRDSTDQLVLNLRPGTHSTSLSKHGPAGRTPNWGWGTLSLPVNGSTHLSCSQRCCVKSGEVGKGMCVPGQVRETSFRSFLQSSRLHTNMHAAYVPMCSSKGSGHQGAPVPPKIIFPGVEGGVGS